MGIPTGSTFDAIVIGSGMSGGYAAKELTEKGLKTLVIESGRDVKHLKDYPTTNMQPWEFKHRGKVPYDVMEEYKTVNRHYIFTEEHVHFLKKDAEQEYIRDKPFDWIRGDQVGGRSLLWARHVQRWSDYDFTGPLRDNYAVDWPIRYADIAPWYSKVEAFVGIAGNKDGLAVIPDGDFLPPFEMTCLEKHFKENVSTHFPERHVIIARVAHLTEPQPIHLEQGRGKCQNRDLCGRGCPFGGYFASNSATLPWAEKTGNLTMLTDTVVHSIIYDEEKQVATGVRVLDKKTNTITEYSARIVFVNASALNSNLILLNSMSERFPNGLGNDNGLMGKFMAFHSYRGRLSAMYDGLNEWTTDGKRPGSSFMPRFKNLLQRDSDFLRGYQVLISSSRRVERESSGFGTTLKEGLLHPTIGSWQINAQMMGETIPKEESRVYLDPVLKDKYGLPQLHVSVAYDNNDEKMMHDFHKEFTTMFEKAGYSDIKQVDTQRNPGNENHEMGGVRMGHDPKTSLLNKWNQLHACKNVFVTDGACMTSTSTQNPSLTYMALTARAANYAVQQIRDGVF